MAAQKTKIWLLSTVTLDSGKKAIYKYATTKSSGKGKAIQGGANQRLKLKKYNPLTKKHEVFEESKFKS
jgi:ribosomal protein L33